MTRSKITDPRLNRLSIAYHDLDKALRFLNEARKPHSNGEVYEALVMGAIILYARPFSNNQKEHDIAKAESRIAMLLDELQPTSPTNSPERFTAEDEALHLKLVTLRNKAIAHAEWDYHPTGVAVHGPSAEEGALRAWIAVTTSNPYSATRDFNELESFLALASKLHDRLSNMRADRLRELRAHARR